MEIFDNRDTTADVFGDLAPGEVFEYDSVIYMKLDSNTSDYTAVNLDNGCPVRFDDETNIKHINCATLRLED